MKKRVFMLVLGASLGVTSLTFIACNDEIEESNYKELSTFSRKFKEVKFYLDNVRFMDDKGRIHTYTGELTVFYDNEGIPMWGSFSGFVDDRIVRDAYVYFYIPSEKTEEDLDTTRKEQEGKGNYFAVFCADSFDDIFKIIADNEKK